MSFTLMDKLTTSLQFSLWIVGFEFLLVSGNYEIIYFQDREANIKANVSIECTAKGEPPFKMNIQDRYGNSLADSEANVNESLTLQAVIYSENSSFKELTCIVENIFGHNSSKTINISYIVPPRIRSAPTVTLISKTKIQLMWPSWIYGLDIGGKWGDAIQYRVVYREENENIWSSRNNWVKGLSANVAKLKPGTLYEVAIVCRREGEGGEGDPGPSLWVKTECDYPIGESQPRDLRVIDANSTSVTLEWEHPLKSQLRCDVNSYLLKYINTTGIYKEQLPATINYTLTNLVPSTFYVVQLSAGTRKGFGISSKLNVRTHDPLRPPVENLTIEAQLEPTHLKISWKELKSEPGHLPTYHVIIYLKKLMKCPTTLTMFYQFNVQNVSNAIIKTLKPYSLYLIQVIAITDTGKSAPAEATQTTSQGVPSASPTNVKSIYLSSTAATFQWDILPCDKTNGEVIKYEYIMILDENRYKRSLEENLPPSSEITETKANITGLIPFFTYGFSVRALTSAGPGPYSRRIEIKTKESIPLTTTYLEVTKRDMNWMLIEWEEPFPSHAYIISFNIRYWINTNYSSINYTAVTREDNPGSIWKTTIMDLQPVTMYSIQNQACGILGCGNWSSSIQAQTRESYPEPPASLTLLKATSNSFEISWQPPIKTNGNITENKVTYVPVLTDDDKFNISEIKPIAIVYNSARFNANMSYLIKRLHTVTLYNVSVQASTIRGYGLPLTKQFWTKLSVPDTPLYPIVDFHEITDSTVSVTIFPLPAREGPVKFYQLIVHHTFDNSSFDEYNLYNYSMALERGISYYITAQLNSKELTKARVFLIGDEQYYGGYFNAHIDKDSEIYIYFRVISIGNEEIQTSVSRIKKPVLVQAQFYLESTEASTFSPKTMLFLIIIICSVIVLLIIVIIIVVLLVRRCKYRNNMNHVSLKSESIMWSVAYKYSEDSSADVVFAETKPGTIRQSKRKLSLRARKGSMHSAIRMEEFPDHVYKQRANAAAGFIEEYKELQNAQAFAPWTVGKRAVNQRKNRYGSIIAYDHSRVILNPQISMPHSDYINANYIDGYEKPKIYIATQGPMENTMVDFWRMIWQERALHIVMLTKLTENHKAKCDQYWADSDSATYGEFKILLMDTEEYSDYVIRTFLVRKITIQVNEQRKIKQYQYLEWPDKKIPLSITSLLKLRHQIKKERPPNAGPTVVHCSAGCGRTGAFITLDAMLDQMENNGYVEIFNYVSKIRTQRINMIQTLDQYIFVYDAILDALNNVDTLVAASNLRPYYNKILISINSQKSELSDQFQKLSSIQPVEPFLSSIALSQSNRPKNRTQEIVPTDEKRVILHIPYEFRGDYICASYIDGYIQKRNLVVTQHPLSHTVIDFWRMINSYKLSIIVMLNSINKSAEDCEQSYWPSDGNTHYGIFQVEVVTFEDHGPFMKRIMRLSNTSQPGAEPLNIVHFQFTDWQEGDSVPTSPISMLKLLSQVRYWQKKNACNPIVIHCIDGASRSGLFCAANITCEKLMLEKVVDIFQMVKRLKQQRQQLISDEEQYKFCYQMALAYLEDSHAYSFCA